MFCSLCGADNPNDGRFCAKCGAVLQGQKGIAGPGLALDGLAQPWDGPTQTSGKAIGSLICGLIFFFFPTAIVAIVLGHLSLSDIRKAGGRLTGHGLAVAGLVLGYAGAAFIPFVLIIAAIAIPNLLRARTAANEASAVGSLRTIETAAITYSATYSNGYPPTLDALGESDTEVATCDRARLIDSGLATGVKNGYYFAYLAEPLLPQDRSLSAEARARGCTVPGAERYHVSAAPTAQGSNVGRSFYADQSGVIRSQENGFPATARSRPLD
ncbi:MAG TPA: DUF4190 domain-containing protein [Candidatus Acidoferrales bacterium]|nr:DUF4190 domain-containing protein [Candidatus Acidoferrales bacterium]